MEFYPTNIKSPSSIEDIIRVPASSVVSIGGYAMTRKIGTRVNRGWKLLYNNISEAEKSYLTVFFNRFANETFIWTHPESNIVYNVFFNNYNIVFKRLNINKYSCTVEFFEDATA